ncbi:VOC family protein [Actinomycetota bacterium Odt1-20B]
MQTPDAELDHLVYATPDLQTTVADTHRRTGVRPVEGGRHLGLGTRNYLLGLGGRRYLEIVGPDPEQPAPARPRLFGIDSLTRPALVTWAVRTDDIAALVAAARRDGYDPGDAEPMSRRTPEGELLSWSVAFTAPGVLPFLIDWGSTAHPCDRGLPAADLLAFTGAHPDPATTARHLRAIGARLDVVQAQQPALAATIEGPAGRMTLASG